MQCIYIYVCSALQWRRVNSLIESFSHFGSSLRFTAKDFSCLNDIRKDAQRHGRTQCGGRLDHYCSILDIDCSEPWFSLKPTGLNLSLTTDWAFCRHGRIILIMSTEYPKLIQFVSHFSEPPSKPSTMSTFIHSPASPVLRRAWHPPFYTCATWSTAVWSNGSSRYMKSTEKLFASIQMNSPLLTHPPGMIFTWPALSSQGQK